MACFIAYYFVVLVIVLDESNFRDGGAYCLVFVEDIEKTDIAFAGAVYLADTGNTETALELIPDVRPQTIAQHFLKWVILFFRAGWLHGEITAQLPHINETVRLVLLDVGPEVRGRKAASQYDRSAGGNKAAESWAHTGDMVDWQTEV